MLFFTTTPYYSKTRNLLKRLVNLKDYLYSKYPALINEGLFNEKSLKVLVAQIDFIPTASLAAKYTTTVQMLSYYMCGYHEDHGINPKKIFTWPTKDGGVMVEFSSRITRDEYYANWKSVEALKSGKGKRIRGAERWTLIYAIQKALRHNKSWDEINAMYEKGELYDYQGSNKQFNGAYELEKYFNKYKFTP